MRLRVRRPVVKKARADVSPRAPTLQTALDRWLRVEDEEDDDEQEEVEKKEWNERRMEW